MKKTRLTLMYKQKKVMAHVDTVKETLVVVIYSTELKHRFRIREPAYNEFLVDFFKFSVISSSCILMNDIAFSTYIYRS